MTERYQRIFVSILLVLLSPQLLFGWSEGGHNVIGFLAFRRMSPEKQEKFIATIKQHPNFDKDFKIPKNVSDAGDEPVYVAGRASYWPDVARSYKEFNRPTWHYQRGASIAYIDKNPGSQLDIPNSPGPLPADATQNLHAVWDQLIGPRFDLSGVKRRVVEIESLQQTEDWRGRPDKPSDWRKEIDVSLAVYTDEVMQWVHDDRTEPLQLSETYLKSAGSIAQFRAKKAGELLAMIWSEGL